MIVHHLASENSIIHKFINELRDQSIQKDAQRFRRNIERIGEILAYEISKTLDFSAKSLETPLATYHGKSIADAIVICSVLRAGLPLHNGLLNYFDDAENTFISAFRHQTNTENDFEIVVEYLASPSLEGKTLILADPMLATGQSMVAVLKALKAMGKPKKIHIASVIGATEGVEFIKKHFPEDTTLWIAAIDENLNEKGYIVPGLGDAGDLAFGSKLQH
ncbi:uracil phosphoribosyltransferase [Pustulibacterium marinum]|uniref:Uracil phosphoribosyltransferase n=1 Tax=Pustulibacterium marinum TaxID=1224947 RepID=A0A1I7ETT3_9FLAO|nr:uracil phosphoribosyltransferase [Pustulibacterium marinum]SFU27335.1 uracil phosphoribosyltransferase [Pustulibacterium marinum]